MLFGIVNLLSNSSAFRRAKVPNSNVGTGMAAFSELTTTRLLTQLKIEKLFKSRIVYLLQLSLDILEERITFL